MGSPSVIQCEDGNVYLSPGQSHASRDWVNTLDNKTLTSSLTFTTITYSTLGMDHHHNVLHAGPGPPPLRTPCWAWTITITYSTLGLDHHHYVLHDGPGPPPLRTPRWAWTTTITYSTLGLDYLKRISGNKWSSVLQASCPSNKQHWLKQGKISLS